MISGSAQIDQVLVEYKVSWLVKSEQMRKKRASTREILVKRHDADSGLVASSSIIGLAPPSRHNFQYEQLESQDSSSLSCQSLLSEELIPHTLDLNSTNAQHDCWMINLTHQ